MTPVDRILRIVLNTPDVERLAAFYIGTLGFEPVTTSPRDALLDLGGTRLVLRRVDRTIAVPHIPGWSPWFQHCAIAVTDMATAFERLTRADDWTAISTAGPETLSASSGGVIAFKFRDPDGHPLELLDLRESAASENPFLRIDHTAISVVDVDRSVAFYENLGLIVAGRSLNRGEEQERLDDVPAALVDVLTLLTKTRTGPHLELLGYRGPFDRPAGRLDQDAIAATTTVFRRDASGDESIHDPDGHRLALDDLSSAAS